MLSLSETSIALMLESIWAVIPSSARISEIFLIQISLDSCLGEKVGIVAHLCKLLLLHIVNIICPSVKMPLIELAIIVIIGMEVSTLQLDIQSLLRRLLMMGILPFSQLKSIIGMRRENEVRCKHVSN